MRTLLAVASAPVWPATNGISLRQAALLPILRRSWRVVLASPEPGSGVDTAAVDEHIPVPGLRRWNPSPDRNNALQATTALAQVIEQLEPFAVLPWVGAEQVVFHRSRGPVVVTDRVDAMTLSAWREIRERGLGLRRHDLTTLASFAAYERRVVRDSDATVVVGEDDARVLRYLSGRSTVHVVGNGVATAACEPPPSLGHPTVVFTGVMDFPPNADAALHFARAVWPAVHGRRPDSRFVIAGRRPLPAVAALHGTDGIEVWPDVPSMRAVLLDAWVVVAPMRLGTGIKNKVLEAWAVGRPVVMTSMAANGLVPSPLNDELIVDDPVAMAGRIASLLDSLEERAFLGSGLHAHVTRYHQWEPLAERLSQLLSAQGPSLPAASARPKPRYRRTLRLLLER